MRTYVLFRAALMPVLLVLNLLFGFSAAATTTNSLTVNLSGLGQGQVTSSSLGQASLPGISCKAGALQGVCTSDFPTGDPVTLTASASAFSSFDGWSGGGCSGTGPCTVTLNANTTVTASFSQLPSAMLSVNLIAGQGTVTSSPSGISCGATCNASFALDTMVTLTATPAPFNTFLGWTSGGCQGSAPCTITLAQATTVSANFQPVTNPDVVLVASLLPTSRSVEIGQTVTVFATMINTSKDTPAGNCTVGNYPGSLSFYSVPTDPATNAVIGTPNQRVTIAPGAAQSFLLVATPDGVSPPTESTFIFYCSNAPVPAPIVSGVNTLLVSSSSTPTPDVIALAATVSNDGIVDIPGTAGTGAFAVASVNVGSSGAITVTANDGTANLPLTITICQTNPSSGQCLAPPAASVPTTINANTTPTFSIFAKGNGAVPFQPAVNRIFVQFKDVGGTLRGSTSVAVRTQ